MLAMATRGRHSLNGFPRSGSLTFRAVMSVSASPDGIASMPIETLEAHARPLLHRWRSERLNHTILHRLHASASESGGLRAERTAAAERATLTARAWLDATTRPRDAEARMTSVH